MAQPAAQVQSEWVRVVVLLWTRTTRAESSRAHDEDGDGAPAILKINGDVPWLARDEWISEKQQWRGMGVCTARELARGSAAGDEEDEDALLDSRLPASIPWARRERTTRRRRLHASICPGRSQAPAMRDGIMSRVRPR